MSQLRAAAAVVFNLNHSLVTARVWWLTGIVQCYGLIFITRSFENGRSHSSNLILDFSLIQCHNQEITPYTNTCEPISCRTLANTFSRRIISWLLKTWSQVHSTTSSFRIHDSAMPIQLLRLFWVYMSTNSRSWSLLWVAIALLEKWHRTFYFMFELSSREKELADFERRPRIMMAVLGKGNRLIEQTTHTIDVPLLVCSHLRVLNGTYRYPKLP
jgi:hypothetical protein